MTDVIKTSERVCEHDVAMDDHCEACCPHCQEDIAEMLRQLAPPSIALARMAYRLAYVRIWGIRPHPEGTPVPRVIATEHPSTAQAEYYRIIDRISDGEAP